MIAAVLKDKYKIEMCDIPIPNIDDTQILVRNKACAVCNATDLKFYKGVHSLIKYPNIIGHEGVGVVEAVGKAVTKVKIGDRVLAGGYPSSPEMASLWGQYSEYGVIWSENDVVFIPDNISMEQATCVHMLSEALNAARIAEIAPGDNIVIIGAGAVGISLLTILKHFFAGTIIVIDLMEDKLALAKKLGADVVLNAGDAELREKVKKLTGDRGVNKLFEAVGNVKTYDLAADLIGRHGTIIAFGMIEKELELSFRKFSSKEAQMKWCASAGDEFFRNKELVFNMMTKGLIDVTPLITSVVPLENLVEGFEKIAAGKEIRVVITI